VWDLRNIFFAFFSLFLVALRILKREFTKFSEKIKECKDALDARLTQKETISSADECWLDHEANIVDEQCVLNNLEAASDYERGG
jgi:hypothetical protein